MRQLDASSIVNTVQGQIRLRLSWVDPIVNLEPFWYTHTTKSISTKFIYVSCGFDTSERVRRAPFSRLVEVWRQRCTN